VRRTGKSLLALHGTPWVPPSQAAAAGAGASAVAHPSITVPSRELMLF